MLLSLWIIKDWLKDIVKEVRIRNSRIETEGARLYSSGSRMDRNLLYIGASDTFFNDGDNSIICKCQDDYLRLDSDDLIFVSNSIQDAFHYYNEWDEQCRKVLNTGGTLNDLLDLSLDLFPTPIIIVDAAQTIVTVSSAKAEFQDSEEWQEAIKRGSVSDEKLKNFNLEHPEMYTHTNVFAVDPKYFFTKGYCKHIFINGARRASVIIKAPNEDYSAGRLQLFGIYADYIKDWIVMRGEDDSSFRINSYFTRALQGDKGAVQAMLRQTSLFGWDDRCTKVLFVLKPVSESNMVDMHMISKLTREAEGTYAMVFNRNIIILENSDIINSPSFSNTLNDFMRAHSCTGAASFAFTDMNLMEQAYRLALSAVESNPSIPGVLYHCQDTSFRRIIGILNEQAANTLQHPALAIIKDFDLKNRTDYCKTLFCYLKNERHHNQTAEELFIHRNTLFQRLQKIQEIWPLNLEDPEERFHLLISFYQDHMND